MYILYTYKIYIYIYLTENSKYSPVTGIGLQYSHENIVLKIPLDRYKLSTVNKDNDVGIESLDWM